MIDDLIAMIETVSSHFGYTEEYVLGHTLPWLKRKFKQADREAYESRKQQSDEVTRGLMAAISSVLGGKKGIDEILLRPYEELITQKTEKQDEAWNTNKWWKRPQK